MILKNRVLHVNYVEISLTNYKEWSVIYYKPFEEISFYKEATNWGVIKLLNNLLAEV